MAGWNTNGLPLVAPGSANGVAAVPPAAQVTTLLSNALLQADTETSGGQTPQSVAASAFQVAATAAALMASSNQAAATTGAATLSKRAGLISTESLSTAVGATYTLTLTNTLISTAIPAPQVAIHSLGNTAAGAQMVVTSVTNGSGSVVMVFTNIGTAAVAGTMAVAFHL